VKAERRRPATRTRRKRTPLSRRRMRREIEEDLRHTGWGRFRDGKPPGRCLIADEGALRLEVYYDEDGAELVEYRQAERPGISEMILFDRTSHRES
jgi:hypothetical protein